MMVLVMLVTTVMVTTTTTMMVVVVMIMRMLTWWWVQRWCYDDDANDSDYHDNDDDDHDNDDVGDYYDGQRNGYNVHRTQPTSMRMMMTTVTMIMTMTMTTMTMMMVVVVVMMVIMMVIMTITMMVIVVVLIMMMVNMMVIMTMMVMVVLRMIATVIVVVVWTPLSLCHSPETRSSPVCHRAVPQWFGNSASRPGTGPSSPSWLRTPRAGSPWAGPCVYLRWCSPVGALWAARGTACHRVWTPPTSGSRMTSCGAGRSERQTSAFLRTIYTCDFSWDLDAILRKNLPQPTPHGFLVAWRCDKIPPS